VFPVALYLFNPVMKKQNTPTSPSTATLNAINAKDGGRSVLDLACDMQDTSPSSVDRDYSGRGMYGDSCVAYIFENYSEAKAVQYAVGKVTGGKAYASIDNLGRNYVVYCPSLSIEDSE